MTKTADQKPALLPEEQVMNSLGDYGQEAFVPVQGEAAGGFQMSAEEALRLLHVHHAGPELLSALEGLVAIIQAAGIGNLSRGVELGAVSWSVKAHDRMEAAHAAIAKARASQPAAEMGEMGQ